jgi:hypothetical protein
MCLSIRKFILEVEKLFAHRFQLRTRVSNLYDWLVLYGYDPTKVPKWIRNFILNETNFKSFEGSSLIWQLTNNQKMLCDSGRPYTEKQNRLGQQISQFLLQTIENDCLKRCKYLTLTFQLFVTIIFMLMVETV